MPLLQRKLDLQLLFDLFLSDLRLFGHVVIGALRGTGLLFSATGNVSRVWSYGLEDSTTVGWLAARGYVKSCQEVFVLLANKNLQVLGLKFKT